MSWHSYGLRITRSAVIYPRLLDGDFLVRVRAESALDQAAQRLLTASRTALLARRNTSRSEHRYADRDRTDIRCFRHFMRHFGELVGIVLAVLLAVATPALAGPACPDIPGVCPPADGQSPF